MSQNNNKILKFFIVKITFTTFFYIYYNKIISIFTICRIFEPDDERQFRKRTFLNRFNFNWQLLLLCIYSI